MKKSSVIHLIFALTITILMGASYSWWYAEIMRKNDDVASIDSQINLIQRAMSHVTSARAALTEISGDEERLQNYFISETGVVSFIDMLQARGFAQKTFIDVLSVSIGGTATQRVLLLAVTISGTFDAVMRMVGAIEYAPYDISVSSLSVQQNAKNNWQANLSLTVGFAPIKVATTSATSSLRTL